MFSGLLAALALIAVYLYVQNNWLQLSRYALKADLEKPMTIVQLSDLHNARFGEAQARLMDMVRAQSPDAIVITGDLIDDTKGDDAPALELARGCAAIAPTYFVTGNHEKLSPSYEAFLPALEEAGVIDLSGKTVTLENGVTLTGAQDAGFIGRENYAGYVASLAPEAAGYHILLATGRSLSRPMRRRALIWRSAAMRTAGRFACPLSAGCTRRGRASCRAIRRGFTMRAT